MGLWVVLLHIGATVGTAVCWCVTAVAVAVAVLPCLAGEAIWRRGWEYLVGGCLECGNHWE